MGLARAQGYSVTFDDYVQNANRESLIMVQIEHIDAVRNIDEILSVPGIDGAFIGPYDLSVSLRVPGQLRHPEVEAAQQRVLEATKAHGLVLGFHLVHPDTAPKDLEQCIALGYRFIALGTDILFLGDSCRTLHATAQCILKRHSVV